MAGVCVAVGGIQCRCVCVLQWEVFSVPELENFLAMLSREEAEHLDRLRTRYLRLRVHLLSRAQQLRAT